MERRTLLKAGLVVPAALSTVALSSSPAQAALTPGAPLATGLNYPWGIDFLSDGSALVTERNSGRVLRVQPDGGYSVVGTVPGVYNNGGEGGLMGLALSPDYATDHWVYVFLTTRTDNRIVRMQYTGSGLGAPQVVLSGIPRNQTHNGGGLWFSDYPSLFATTGDTRHPEFAQNRSSLAGKILRMKPDGSPQTGNPYGTRVYTHGHRNPEGITIADGRIWSSELGENTWDELNLIRAGRNYGWAKVEGNDGPHGYTNPYAQWHTDECSPSGVAVVEGRAWVGALRGQCLWSVDIEGRGARAKHRYFHNTYGRIRMVKKGPDGSLWIGTSNGGNADKIIRLRFT